jgi:hypothetical protein
VQDHQPSSRTETNQAETNAGWEGWLAPAQCALHSTLNLPDIERGQATLPNLHLCEIDLLQRGLSAAVLPVDTCSYTE